MEKAMYNNDHYKYSLLEKIKKEALEIDTERILSSGKKSNYYIDGKMVTLDSEGSFLTAKVIFDMIAPIDFDAIGGLTLGADPIVAALALFGYINKRPIQTFIVRKEPKKHGTMKLIEGKLVQGSKVIIVDDVVTTGNSILQAINVVKQEKCEVVKIIALVDRQEGAREKFNSLGYEFEPIFTKEDLGITDEC
jgi:orotate phosphoribosyltransferase